MGINVALGYEFIKLLGEPEGYSIHFNHDRSPKGDQGLTLYWIRDFDFINVYTKKIDWCKGINSFKSSIEYELKYWGEYADEEEKLRKEFINSKELIDRGYKTKVYVKDGEQKIDVAMKSKLKRTYHNYHGLLLGEFLEFEFKQWYRNKLIKRQEEIDKLNEENFGR